MTTTTTTTSSLPRQYLAALGIGVLFALGLGISGMTRPGKVIGFLDFFGGAWDPALAFVMGGGVLIYAIGYRLTIRREAPRFASTFQLPTRRDIDGRLVLGSVLFGAGWGLGGYCPGPAMTSLATVSMDVFVFVASMGAGMVIWALLNRKLSSPKSPTHTSSAGVVP